MNQHTSKYQGKLVYYDNEPYVTVRYIGKLPLSPQRIAVWACPIQPDRTLGKLRAMTFFARQLAMEDDWEPRKAYT